MKNIAVAACLLLALLSFAACDNAAKDSTPVLTDSLAYKSPKTAPEVFALIDTLNKGNLGDRDTARAMQLVLDMIKKYPVDEDAYNHHLLIQQLARNYLIRGDNDSLIKYATIGLNYFEQQKYFNKWVLIDHYRLSIAYYEEGNYDDAIMHANKARLETLHPELADIMPPRVMSAYLNDLALLCRVALYYEEGKKLASRSMQMAQNLPLANKNLYSQAIVEKSRILLENNELDSAAIYIGASRRTVAQYPDQRSEIELARCLALYYSMSKEWDSVVVYAAQVVGYESESSPEDANALSLSELGEAYLNLGEKQKAAACFERGINSMRLHPTRYELRDSSIFYSRLPSYYNAMDNSAAADAAFQLYKDLEHRFINMQHIRAVKSLEAQYELKQKETKIASLHDDSLAYQLELKQKNIFLIAGAAALAIVVLAALWATSLQRQKRLKAEKEKLQQEKNKTQLEQRLLRAQMEPHFIFNALAVLQSFIREGDEDKSVMYVNKFARLMRQSLEHSREPFVLLTEEIDATKNYLDLQRMRFEGLFNYEIHIDESIDEEDELKVPPMLLQPFVENSILHGFKGIKYTGILSIDIKREGRTLKVLIADNGNGINLQTESDVKAERKSLSTIITRERLRILSDESGLPSGLSINHNTPQGVLVTMTIPLV